ncbi:flagellar protein FliT [Burkholderia vietnamiensis]|uniref:Flagellar protein FliT n=1 Tax=Burkholderia vietnamiensis (strain G4 / LMG 22486) TaxID=269482 RepID=A4JAB1_BURVG|nr:flagellar protein FliT [Burkholderia vietnamiensis]ABO53214.1 conserved hypothetical protein [Burkholderia vietnamiensis G4]MCB4346250.1 flagellar protein FliT [Burkholderia vietnamiensis]HDR9165564.1 flagellar protein FliT [Burkholderia vietnamiensis]
MHDGEQINHKREAIDRVWNLTKAIKAAGANRDWPEAARLVAERSPLLLAISAPQSAPEWDILRAIYDADQSIMRDAQAAQSELRQTYHGAINAVRNTEQYQRIAQS